VAFPALSSIDNRCFAAKGDGDFFHFPGLQSRAGISAEFDPCFAVIGPLPTRAVWAVVVLAENDIVKIEIADCTAVGI